MNALNLREPSPRSNVLKAGQRSPCALCVQELPPNRQPGWWVSLGTQVTTAPSSEEPCWWPLSSALYFRMGPLVFRTSYLLCGWLKEMMALEDNCETFAMERYVRGPPTRILDPQLEVRVGLTHRGYGVMLKRGAALYSTREHYISSAPLINWLTRLITPKAE